METNIDIYHLIENNKKKLVDLNMIFKIVGDSFLYHYSLKY